MLSRGLLLLAVVALQGCAVSGLLKGSEPASGTLSSDGPPLVERDVSRLPMPVPKAEPRIPRGNVSPYRVFGIEYEVMPTAEGYEEVGTASWYGRKFHGRLTSSGEPYDMFALTAAHKTLPLPSYVEVTNLANNEQIIVRVNDRGPFAEGRIIDLSWAAARRLGFDQLGTARVQLKILAHPDMLEPVASWWVQTGSYESSDQANTALAQMTAQAGLMAGQGRVEAVSLNNQPRWRVKLGPFARAEAESVQQRLPRDTLLRNLTQ